MRYMLDTNTCIHIIKYRSGTLYDRLSSLPVEDAGVSSIVANTCIGSDPRNRYLDQRFLHR